MLLPEELDSTLKKAYYNMLENSQNELLPIMRYRIYCQIRLHYAPQEVAIFGWLGLVTAKRVLHLWDPTITQDLIPSLMLDMAEKILRKQLDPAAIKDDLDEAWGTLEDLSNYENIKEDTPEYDASFFAATAAVEALEEAYGTPPLEYEPDEEIEGRDINLDPGGSDTAKWAAVASSGYPERPFSNQEKRKEFWTWWLKEAIPEAIKIATYSSTSESSAR